MPKEKKTGSQDIAGPTSGSGKKDLTLVPAKTPGEPVINIGTLKPKPEPSKVEGTTRNNRRKLDSNSRNNAADKLLVAPPRNETLAPKQTSKSDNPRAPEERRSRQSQAASRQKQPEFKGSFHDTDQLPEISLSTRQEIYGILLVITALIFFFGLLSSDGMLAQIGIWFKRLLGISTFLIPVLILIIGVTYFWEGFTRQEKFNQTRISAAILMTLAFISMGHLFAANSKVMAENGEGAGYLGYYLVAFLSAALTPVGAFLALVGMFLVGAIIAFNISLRDLAWRLKETYQDVREGKKVPLDLAEPVEYSDYAEEEGEEGEIGTFQLQSYSANRTGNTLTPDLEDDELLDELLLGNAAPPPLLLTPSSPVISGANLPSTSGEEKPAQRPLQQKNGQKVEPEIVQPADLPHKEWSLPKLNILASFKDVEVNPQELRKKAKLIEETLANFGVSAYVREVNTGPTVTQFALEPDIGVKVARIVGLQNDLALALAAPSIRIEAPVPGQSRVGIEVPNAKIAVVGLREIMEHDEFTRKPGKLKIALGRDVAGQPIVPDLAKMPHLLIAGSTGSGKSVCINTIIASLLFVHRPDQLQLIMIDPKMVELSTYNGIPHLRFPVVTQIESDPEEERRRSNNERTPTVMSVLKWTIREMERRYKHLSMTGHRNLESYNKVAGVGNSWEKLPFLVLIIDELADLMMVAPEEAEGAICRLAQKARAVGIHLILATQRPSVDVVTGLIKANFPSRITFAVTSQIDSRVILDTSGAEKLLGRGDMLYLPGDAPKPFRAQGTYVGDEEIDALVQFWQKQNDFLTKGRDGFTQTQLWPQDLREIEQERSSGEDETDELFGEALEIVREARSASTSLLQRRLKIGYNRAARLVEELEQAGVIGKGDGSRPRAVLLDEEDLGGPTSLTAAANMPLELTPGQRREREAALRDSGPNPLDAGFFDDDPPL